MPSSRASGSAMSATEQKARTRVVRQREVCHGTVFDIHGGAERPFRQRERDNGLQRRRSARTGTSATRPAGPGGVERWAKNRGPVGPSTNAFAPDIVVRLDSARAALSRLGHVGGVTLTRPSFGVGRGLLPLRLLRRPLARFTPPASRRHRRQTDFDAPSPAEGAIDRLDDAAQPYDTALAVHVNSVTDDFSRNDIRQRSSSTSLWM
jgi:hypothetical protein